MNVRELIEKLQQCDPEKSVCLNVEADADIYYSQGQPEVDMIKEDADVVLLDFGSI